MLFYTVLKHYLPSVLCILSCFCIIPSIYLICKCGLSRPLSVYLIVLAFVDLITGFLLAFLSLDHFLLLLFISTEDAYSIYNTFEEISSELIDVLLLISNWLTVAVAVERYLAICFPLNVRCLTHRVRKRIVLCIILLSIVLQFPLLAKYCPIFHPLWKPLSYFNLWFTRVLLLLVLPCTILVFVTIRLIQAIRSSFILNHGSYSTAIFDLSESTDCTSLCKIEIPKSTRLIVDFTSNGPLGKEQSKQTVREERAISINLICLVVVFFLCQVPFILLSVAFKLYNLETESEPQDLNLTLIHQSDIWKDDFLNQTFISASLVTANNPSVPATDVVLAYIRAFSVIFLMLKDDFYFLFHCWLCKNFIRAVKAFLHI
ncbi:hypothetical protein Aperf_G00000099936 [Anoplocephala perfoliata]